MKDYTGPILMIVGVSLSVIGISVSGAQKIAFYRAEAEKERALRISVQEKCDKALDPYYRAIQNMNQPAGEATGDAQ